MFILICPNCGKMYKCYSVETEKGTQYITDFGDNITNYCLRCNQQIIPKVIQTEDWVANLVFTIKG